MSEKVWTFLKIFLSLQRSTTETNRKIMDKDVKKRTGRATKGSSSAA